MGGECIAELQFGLHPQSGTQILIVSVTRKFKICKLAEIAFSEFSEFSLEN